ncbi:MAG: hypothetical protein LBD34_03395 [Puniceicoccales bacterium]|jgi:chromosome segregation ATPase|nr:hypothetical protein [Puniceicoccales bacterium]
MDSPTASETLGSSQVLSQDDLSNPISSIRSLEETKEFIGKTLLDIGKKTSTALSLFGVDVRFFPKLIHNLKGTATPACITAVSCFVTLHLFPSLGISVIVGIVALINLAVSRTRLEIMKEDLEAAKRAGVEAESCTKKLQEQNTELLSLNKDQEATIGKQKEAIEGAQQNLTTAQDELSSAQENLSKKQRINKLQEEQLAAQKETIDKQEEQFRAQEAYIAQCQGCLTSFFSSQKEMISNLEQSLKTQTDTVQQILQNVQNIAKGEQKLTEALDWAQNQVREIQAKLTEVISVSGDIVDSETCKKLIESGNFKKTAQAMHDTAQEVYAMMNSLNSELTKRILDAQKAIADSRAQTEVRLRGLTSQQQKTSDALKQANDQIQKKEQEIKFLRTKYESELKQINATNVVKTQALAAEIEKEKQSLAALTKEKGALSENLKNVEAQLVSLGEKVHSLEVTNTELQTQCESQKQTIESQKETIDNQRQSLETVQDALNRLQAQTQGGGWGQTLTTFAGGLLGVVAVKAMVG